MALTSKTLKRMLEQAWDASLSSKIPLRDVLRSKEVQSDELLETGSLASTSDPGGASGFANYGPGQHTALEKADGWTQLRDLFDSCLLSLQLAGSPTDDLSVKLAMQASPEIRGIGPVTSNWMFLSK